jgi:hypothetical protein
MAGLLTVSPDRYRTLALTPLGREVMRGGREDLVIAAPVSSRRSSRRSPLRGTYSTFPRVKDFRKLFGRS